MSATARVAHNKGVPSLPVATALQLSRVETIAPVYKPRLPRKEMTPRREQIAKAAALFWRVYRRFPTLRELSAAIGGMALSTLSEHLEALVWLGFINRPPGARQHYGVTDKGMELAFGRCCPCCGKSFSEVE